MTEHNWVECGKCKRWEVYENCGLKGKYNKKEVERMVFECRLCLIEVKIEEKDKDIKILRESMEKINNEFKFTIEIKDKEISILKEKMVNMVTNLKNLGTRLEDECKKNKDIEVFSKGLVINDAKREEEVERVVDNVWSKVLKKGILKKELEEVSSKLKVVEEKIEKGTKDDIERENRKNSIMIYRFSEPIDIYEINKDKLNFVNFLNEGLKLQIKVTDFKRFFRIGNISNSKERPLLVELRDGIFKNQILESLIRLRNAEDSFKRVSITHDMCKSDREQNKLLVDKAKELQKNENSGEWIYKVKGKPGSMRVLKIKAISRKDV